MRVLVEHLPRDSALGRALLGVEADWSIDTYIAAHAAHGIWVANWQRAQGKRHQYPKPIRPVDDDEESIGGGGRTFAEIDALLGQYGPEGGGDHRS